MSTAWRRSHAFAEWDADDIAAEYEAHLDALGEEQNAAEQEALERSEHEREACDLCGVRFCGCGRDQDRLDRLEREQEQAREVHI